MDQRFLDEDFDEFDEEGWEEIELEDEEIPHPKKKKKPEGKPQPVKKASVEICYQDDAILVIDKPSGLDSARGQYAAETVLDRLKVQLPQVGESLRLVHRLDRDTSGVMVLAKTAEAQRSLSSQWETRSVEKTYLAIVHGMVSPPSGTIDIPLKKTQSNIRPVIIEHKKGKPSVTEYQVVDQFRSYGLVRAHPITGRMHQIQVHFAAEGWPVLCDSVYGQADPLYLSSFKRGYRHSRRKGEEKPLIARLALHATALTFNHPASGEPVSFEVEPPKDFYAAIKQLGKYGR